MRNLFFSCYCILTLSLLTPFSAYAGDDELSIIHGSRDSFQIADNVPDTVTLLSDFLRSEGFDILLTIDHAGSAAAVGLELAPTQVIFARQPRRIERRLLQRSETIGIDLPLKFLVFEHDDEIHVDVNATGYLIDRHDIRLEDHLLGLLDSKIKRVTDAPEGLLTVKSLQSFDVTVETFLATISAIPAFRIPLVLDYTSAQNEDDEDDNERRAPLLIVIGNPNVGTPLMQANQRIGIDLPQKFLFWEDRHGNVNITYNDPRFLAERHDVQGVDARLAGIANALRNFALIAAGIN